MLNMENIDLMTDQKSPQAEIRNIKAFLFRLYNELQHSEAEKDRLAAEVAELRKKIGG